jgi:sugar phosphate isomerase/epimerase
LLLIQKVIEAVDIEEQAHLYPPRIITLKHANITRMGEIANRIESDGKDAVLDLFNQADIKPGGWGLPVDWRTKDSAKFVEDLDKLPRFAAAGQAIGCTRCSTWVLSFSDDLPLEDNIEWHIQRFAPVANILGDHGCSLGLEFLGPKTIRDGHKYDFVHDMNSMLQLCERIAPNAGLLLDCWHWYTAGNTVEELSRVSPERVVYVHVNDAPAGIPVDEQRDNVRAMPGETGVIDIAGFLQTLDAIGYDGPVTPEPFSSKVRGVAPEQAVTMTGEAMMKIWRQADIK